MAKYRYIYCDYWTDSEVVEFTPEEKFFYLYVLTNSHTSQCGIYNISLKVMEFEMGYSYDTLLKLIDRFQNSYDKLRYNMATKELAIKNWSKHNSSESPKVKKCVESELLGIKERSLIEYVYGIDTVCIGYQKEKEKEEQKEEQKQKEEEEEEKRENCTELVGSALAVSSEEVFEVYEKSMDKLTEAARRKLVHFLGLMDVGVIVAGMEEAGRYNKRSIKYLEAILNNWHRSGIKTMEDFGRMRDRMGKQWKEPKEEDLDEFITR